MLTCVPQSFFSWDFLIYGAKAGPASVTLNFWSEQGTLTLGRVAYDIRKHGPLSGQWTLEHHGRVYLEARKPSPMFRSFELQSARGRLTVQAVSPFGRSFQILHGGTVLCTIRPLHFLTTRTEIVGAANMPELDQVFAFWLAVLTWRRAARKRNNSSH